MKYKLVLNVEIDDIHNKGFIESCIDHNLYCIEGIERIDILEIKKEDE